MVKARKNRGNRRRARPRKSAKRGRRGRISANPIKELVSKGVRTLLSYIPGGDWISSAASFAWKLLSITEKAPVHYGDFILKDDFQAILADASGFGLSAKFSISPAVILAGSMDAISSDSALTSNEFSSTYYEARVKWLRVKVSLVSKVSERKGMLAAAITPFRDPGDFEKYSRETTPQHFERVARRPGAKTSPASTTLAIPWSPTIHDGYGYFYHPLQTPICMVTLTYQDTSHSANASFAQDGVGFSVTCEGEVGCRQGAVSGYEKFTAKVNDMLATKSIQLTTPNGEYTYCRDESVIHHAPGEDKIYRLVPSLADMEM